MRLDRCLFAIGLSVALASIISASIQTVLAQGSGYCISSSSQGDCWCFNEGGFDYYCGNQTADSYCGLGGAFCASQQHDCNGTRFRCPFGDNCSSCYSLAPDACAKTYNEAAGLYCTP